MSRFGLQRPALRVSAGVICLGLLSSCWPHLRWGIDVREIPKRQDMLSQAVEISVEDFFGRRMRNQIRKAPVGNWMILHQDETYAYLGWPRFSGLLNDQRDVSELFKTRLAELDVRFPAWREFDGEQMQALLRRQLGKLPQRWDAVLEAEFIRVTGTLAEDVPVNETPKGRAFEIKIDKVSLTSLEPS